MVFDLWPLDAFFRKIFWMGMLILVLVTGPLGPGLAPAASETLRGAVRFTTEDTHYRIGPGDVLSFQVYHQPDLTQGSILVRSDGMATFNGVGEIKVEGRTISEVQSILRYELSELIKEPIVSVTVDQTRPGTIYLAGAVKHPGMYQLSTGNQNSAVGPTANGPINRIDLRLSNILANAGGVQMNADLRRIRITRHGNVSEESLEVDLLKMLQEGDTSQDIMLRSGDSIYIPALPSMALTDAEYQMLLNSSIGPGTFPVRVLGELEKPGVYELPGNSPYLNSAISQAGGYKDGASRDVIAIRRFTNEHDFSTLYVNPQRADIVLRPNDIVVVGEKRLFKTGKFFDQVNRILSPFTNAAFSAAIFGGF